VSLRLVGDAARDGDGMSLRLVGDAARATGAA
jgi:hypothetical protein